MAHRTTLPINKYWSGNFVIVFVFVSMLAHGINNHYLAGMVVFLTWFSGAVTNRAPLQYKGITVTDIWIYKWLKFYIATEHVTPWSPNRSELALNSNCFYNQTPIYWTWKHGFFSQNLCVKITPSTPEASCLFMNYAKARWVKHCATVHNIVMQLC